MSGKRRGGDTGMSGRGEAEGLQGPFLTALVSVHGNGLRPTLSLVTSLLLSLSLFSSTHRYTCPSDGAALLCG